MTISYNIDNVANTKMAELGKKYDVPTYQVSATYDVFIDLIANNNEFDDYIAVSEDLSNTDFEEFFRKVYPSIVTSEPKSGDIFLRKIVNNKKFRTRHKSNNKMLFECLFDLAKVIFEILEHPYVEINKNEVFSFFVEINRKVESVG